jgi:hypothetical protein
MERLRIGQQLYSSVDGTAVIVVKAGSVGVQLTCGGAPMSSEPIPAERRATTAELPVQGGTQIGKRYETADGGLELLCTKTGTTCLAVDNAPLKLKAAKALPASD